MSYALRKATKTTEKLHRDADDKNNDNVKESGVTVDETAGGMLRYEF